MSTQSVPRQFPVSLNLAAHAGAKHGPVAVGQPHRTPSLEIPKVGLSELCLSYRVQSGERLLALDHINLEVRAENSSASWALPAVANPRCFT